MSKERRQNLFDKHPALFEKKDSTETVRYPIHWGFEHGDGWLPILEDLCDNIQHHVKQQQKNHPDYLQPHIFQVKEKFGTLRFYLDHGDDYIYGLIAMAEAESARTCEICGLPGTMKYGGWIRVRCEPCEADRQRRMEERESGLSNP